VGNISRRQEQFRPTSTSHPAPALGVIWSLAIMSLEHLHERYNQFASLSDEVQLFWTLASSDDDGNHENNNLIPDDDDIHIAVAYLLPNPLHEHEMHHWLGFGLSPQGGMIGADMMIYLPPSSSYNGTERLLDVNGVAYSFPMLDKCGQDWKLVNYSLVMPTRSDTHAWHIVETNRSLQSNDVNEDLPIINDSSKLIDRTHVVAAWGLLNLDGVEDESNGRLKTRENISHQAVPTNEHLDLTSIIMPHGPLGRVSSAVRFFASTSESNTAKDVVVDLPYIDLIPEQSFSIPDRETTYKNFCFQVEEYPDLMDALVENDHQVHIVAFHDIIGGSSLVHHMDLHGTTNEVLGSDKRLCRVYMDLVHPWEAGSPKIFELPQEAGIPLGGKNGYRAFRVEVHYHNPRRESGLIDRSGVRLYYSIAKRPHVAGLMLLGDYMLKLRGSYTVGSARKNFSTNAAGMRHSFFCPSSCFSKNRLGLQTDDNNSSSVTVFREVLHMHKSGERMTNIHFDLNGTVVRASEANRFDFSQGAGYASRADLPYRISEGDSFLTTCYFSTRGVVWGSSSGNEMCQTFVWYYPKKDYSLTCGYFDPIARRSVSSMDPVGCEMSYDRGEVATETDLGRLHPSEECQAAESSKRSVHSFEPLSADSWPSLFQLVNNWKQSMSTESINFTTTSNSGDVVPVTESNTPLDEVCHLCPNGQRPTRPDAIVEGFSWTCDELDAAIPVIYTQPQLLFFSSNDVAPCKDYHASFGEMCGCPKSEDKPANASASGPNSKPMGYAEEMTRDDIVRLVGGALLLLTLISLFIRQRISLGCL